MEIPNISNENPDPDTYVFRGPARVSYSEPLSFLHSFFPIK